MATSLLYLGLYLGPYSILITAGSGGVYIYSYCSCCGCYRVARAAIRVANSTAIRVATGTVIGITSGTTVGIANRISRGSYGHYYKYYCGDFYRGFYKNCWQDRT